MALDLALLHVGAAITPTTFSVHPSVVVGLVALAGLYEWRVKQQARGEPARASRFVLRGSQRLCFYAAVGTMFMSLDGWLHDLSDYYLFSAHMVQHLLLALVIAPLFIMGTPGWMLRPALSVRGVEPVARWLTRPTHTFAIFNIVMAAWHLPPLYNTAMAYHNVHIFQHLTFLVTAVLMWWPVLSPLPELPRLNYPGQMLYLFLMTIPMSIVAIYIAMADSILYPAYASAPRIWGISPMNDQLLGGLIMWIPGGLYFFTIISVVFFRWQQRDGVESREGAQVDWPAANQPV